MSDRSHTRAPQENERFVSMVAARLSNHRDAQTHLYALDASGVVWVFTERYKSGQQNHVRGWAPMTNERFDS